ncbi:MAG: hypothetical protein KDA37_13700 [Planctomycetales bacterium]|nr:hypothetical protein [Planctomycetales bacterium]
MRLSHPTVAAILLLTNTAALSAQEHPLPVVAADDFEQGAENWELLDPRSWRVAHTAEGRVLSQHRKDSDYKPPHRSPFHVALLRAPIVTDFEYKVRVKSTHEDYGHRDACLFFGFQDEAHFYYVHLGKEMDPHANQVFIVNGADRKKISTKTTKGTPWDDQWHTLRIVRDTQSGSIKVFWDVQREPIMTASDKTFAWGNVGVGSFDDTADFDDVELRGIIPKPDPRHGLPIQTPVLRERHLDVPDFQAPEIDLQLPPDE